MFNAIKSAWTLLLGIAFLMLGNGLQGTLVGLRATLEGFSTSTTGLIMTGYFAGFVLGSKVVPKLLKNVGHVRVFAALASLASVSALLHSIYINPVAWTGMRLITGFCFSGLYIVAESWLNDIATNRTRGQLLSVYMVVLLGGMAAGQFLLNIADPASFELFVLISALVSLALVPITLTLTSTPEFSTPAGMSWRALYLSSPLGVVGTFGTGMAHGAFFSMGAVFATNMGLSVPEVAKFMAAMLFGGVLLQWPIGIISDQLDRRQVITGIAALAAMVVWAVSVLELSGTVLYVSIGFFGGLSMPLYSLCIAHANDYLEPSQRVPASGTLVLVGGIGAILGPSACSTLMDVVGDRGFLWYLAVVHGYVAVFALWRMTCRAPVPLEDQHHYAPVAPRSSPVAVAIASRTVRDYRDRDLAKWSKL